MNKLKLKLDSHKDQIMEAIIEAVKPFEMDEYEPDIIRFKKKNDDDERCKKVRKVVKYTNPNTGKVSYKVVVVTEC